MPESIFLSIKPIYAEKILTGEKTIELRKFKPTVYTDQAVFLYATAPEQKLLGFFLADKVVTASPNQLWKKYGRQSCVSKSDFDAYFANCELAHGILVKSVHRFETPPTLNQLREIDPEFRPPQGYLYLNPPRKLAMYLDVYRRMSQEKV